jgi:hypothetical protein
MKTDGPNGAVNVDINRFPPFNLINLTHIPEGSLDVFGEFRNQFAEFTDVLRYDLVLSGEDIVPLFRTESSTIAGAAFRVGKGAIVFSPPPKIGATQNC